MQNIPPPAELLDVAEAAARAGAEELRDWRHKFTVQAKGKGDFVTEADLASQDAIARVIRKTYSEHGVLGEENAALAELEKPYCWIVDPLDGTTNYLHGFPFYAVSVAVASRGVVLAGVVYDVVSDEIFTAVEGGGAFANGQPIRTRETTLVEDALVAVSFPPQVEPASPDLAAFMRVVGRCRAVRRTGSAALNLAYVAAGRLDAHWAHHIFPWDSAAGTLLVSEAGGTVTNACGDAYDVAEGDYLVAGTTALQAAMCPLVAYDSAASGDFR